jgi:transcriptional regulator with XRE-family HTH domain
MIIDGKSFGGKVRELRKQKGLTLAALATKTRRSVSLISQIETGNISPSFSSMQIIAEALGVPLGRIMSDGPVPEGGDCCVMSASARKILQTQGGVQHQLLSRGLSLPFEFNILELPPGASTGEDRYSHAGEECGLILKGEVELEVDGQVHRLKPGDSVTMRSSVPHKLSNPGKITARAVWVNSIPYVFSTR